MSGASLFERGRRLQLSSRENGNLAAVFEAAPNLLAARSTARFSPYMVPVSRARACVSELRLGDLAQDRAVHFGGVGPRSANFWSLRVNASRDHELYSQERGAKKVDSTELS